MIVEDAVAYLHLVTHEVAGLIVSHTVPAGGLLRGIGEVLDRKTIGLALDEPAFLIGHGCRRCLEVVVALREKRGVFLLA